MPRHSPDSLKEVIRDFRRDQIIDVARDLFGARGTTEVPMDEIATHAGVARSTIYVYFSNRDELLRACLERMYAQLKESMVSAWAGDAGPATRLRAVVDGMLARIDENPAFFRLAVATQAIGTRPAAEAVDAELALIGLDMAVLLEELVAEGTADGTFRHIDPARGAVLIGQQLFGALSVRAGDPSPIPREQATTEICQFILFGLHSDQRTAKTDSP